MTASGLPAVLTKLAISVVPGTPSGDALLDDIADMAESIDEFRGAPFPDSGLEVEGLPMVADPRVCRLVKGFGVTSRSDTLLVAFVGLGITFDLC